MEESCWGYDKVSLWRTWEFIFFVNSGPKTNITSNYPQRNMITWSERQQTCFISRKYIKWIDMFWRYFRRFSHFSKCKELRLKFIMCCLTIVLQIMFECFSATQEWMDLNNHPDSHDIIISIVIMKNQSYLQLPSSGHIQTRCVFVDNFEFAT